MMYMCCSCKYEFDEPKIVRDFVGYYGSAPAYQDWAVCPHCGDVEFDEMQRCCECDVYYPEDEMYPGTDVCMYCAEDMDMDEEWED